MRRELSLDIVICTYNNAALLDRALDAVARQRAAPGVRWQVLVVDNNCTDETASVVEGHARSGAFPLRMIREPKQGLTPARVCGARNTRGEWIAFVDDDCLLAEDWVEQAALFAAEHPECGAFGGRIILSWEAPPPPYVLNFPFAYAGANHGDRPRRRPWLAGAGMVVRREALEASGWLDEQFVEDRMGKQLVSGGDVEIPLRIGARHEVWYHPGCQLRHVIPARRTSRQYLRRMIYGLGAGRHNATALAWRGSYAGWLLYSAACSLGFLALGVRQLALEACGRRPGGVDVIVAFGTVAGWWAAMWHMLWMNPARRRQLVGCAAGRGD